MIDTTKQQGMATEAQKKKITELVTAPNFTIPLAGFLKNITGNTASSIDELTSAQADDVLGVFKKLVKAKK